MLFLPTKSFSVILFSLMVDQDKKIGQYEIVILWLSNADFNNNNPRKVYSPLYSIKLLHC